MNVRLVRAASRNCPAIVPFLWDAFDRCDPTRSHESKPSVRAREDRHTRRIIRSVLAWVVLAVVALLAAAR